MLSYTIVMISRVIENDKLKVRKQMSPNQKEKKEKEKDVINYNKVRGGGHKFRRK